MCRYKWHLTVWLQIANRRLIYAKHRSYPSSVTSGSSPLVQLYNDYGKPEGSLRA